MDRLVGRRAPRLQSVGLCLGLSLLVSNIIAQPASAQLKAGDHVAIIGDSITEQKLYSIYMEEYLLMCKPVADLRTTQFGWSGETSWGFDARMENDCLRFKPTAATTCFGMNDGGYSPQTADKAKHYHDAQTEIVEKLKKGGVRFIVVGSPGVVDSESFHHKPQDAEMYNKTLASERDLAKQVAQEQGVTFADVFDAMMGVMQKAKAKYGNSYEVAGGDGVHPGANGHLVMAYAFLKALGCDGNIGTITVDLAAGKADATEGHKVESIKDGVVEVESSRYPFCFFGDPKSSQATSGVIEFFPFNEDLNRFKLIVKGGQGDKFKVSWGKASKEFSAQQLAQGINLAAEFPVDNPFADQFKHVEDLIKKQQNLETPLVKEWTHSLIGQNDPKLRDATEKFVEGAIGYDKALAEMSSAAVKPVKHTIHIELVK